jgi:hypothetical protein
MNRLSIDAGGLRTLQREAAAGLSAALVSLPVAIGYGLFALAPLGPQFYSYGVVAGLYSAIVMNAVALLMGARAPLLYGPRNMVAFMINALVLHLLVEQHEELLAQLAPQQVVAIVLANAAVLVLLAASLVARIVRVWAERRRGSAGSRLHVRLVLLFGVVAVVPALIVAAFAAVFFNLGIQAWFNDRVRSTLEVSLVASRAWLDNHRDEIRVDALAMAADLNRAAQIFLPQNPIAFERTLATQASIRGLTEAVVIEPRLGQIVAQAGFVAGGTIANNVLVKLHTVEGQVVVTTAITDNPVGVAMNAGKGPLFPLEERAERVMVILRGEEP